MIRTGDDEIHSGGNKPTEAGDIPDGGNVPRGFCEISLPCFLYISGTVLCVHYY